MARRPKKMTPAKAPGVRRPELLPSGRYRGWTWNPHTKKKGASKTFVDEVSADAWMRRAQAELEGTYTAAGVEEPRRRRARVAFAEYALGWAEQGAEPTTRATRRVHARALGQEWPGLAVDEIDRLAVKQAMAAMERRGLSPGTRRNRLTAMRGIFGEAILDGLRADDPTRNIEQVASTTLRVHRVLTREEFALVLDVALTWLRPALLLAHDAGLRISEVCGLRWHRLDLLHGVVMVGDVVLTTGDTRSYLKGKKVLPVSLTERTLTALRAHQQRHPGGPAERVFVEPGGDAQLLDPARLRYLWAGVVKRAEIAEPRPWVHDLRHGCGHALREAGAPLDVIQVVLRHQNIATSMIYTPEVSDAEARRWLDATQDGAQAPEGGRSAAG